MSDKTETIVEPIYGDISHWLERVPEGLSASTIVWIMEDFGYGIAETQKAIRRGIDRGLWKVGSHLQIMRMQP